MIDLIDITTAAEILQLGETRARALLEPPEKCTNTINGRPRFLYCRQRVELIANQRKCEKCQRAQNRGKRPCYICRTKCNTCELTSGMCENCRAFKIMRNFICHGDCLFHKPDQERLEILRNALSKLQTQLSAGNANAM